MLVKIVGNSLLKRVRITIWTLATLSTCAALVTLFAALAVDAEKKMSGSLRRLGANAVVYSDAQPSGRMTEPGSAGTSPKWETVKELAVRADAGVAVLQGRVGTLKGKPVAVITADPKELSGMTPYWVVRGRRPVSPGEGLAGMRAAAAFGIKEGSEGTIRWNRPGRESRIRIAGIFESGDEDEDRIFLPAPSSTTTTSAEAATSEMPPPLTSYALLSVPGGEKGIGLLAERLDAGRAGVAVKPLRQILHGEQKTLEKIKLLSAFALLAVLSLSSLGVSAAVLARVAERRQELALFQALGAKRRLIVLFLLYESAILGIVSAAAGFLLGTFMAQAVTSHIFQVSVTPHLTSFLAALAVTVGVALAAGGAGARRALKLEPAVALRGE
jgi:putative ABC transport system permease protein